MHVYTTNMCCRTKTINTWLLQYVLLTLIKCKFLPYRYNNKHKLCPTKRKNRHFRQIHLRYKFVCSKLHPIHFNSGGTLCPQRLFLSNIICMSLNTSSTQKTPRVGDYHYCFPKVVLWSGLNEKMS